MKTKNTILTLLMLLSGTFLFSQKDFQVEFIYDAAGNRIERNVIQFTKEEGKKQKTTTKSSPVQAFTQSTGNTGITVYPNPTKGKLTVEISGTEKPQAVTIEIYTLAGERLKQTKKAKACTKLDFSDLPSGTYILKVTTGNNAVSWKIIKE